MILVDTGYWYALGNSRDKHHDRAVEVGKSLLEDPVTTWPVLTETCHLLRRSLGTSATVRFLAFIESNAVEVFDIGHEHIERIGGLMRKHDSLPMDLADASLVILAEHLGHGRILSTDRRDFGVHRWKSRDPFENLMFPDDTMNQFG